MAKLGPRASSFGGDRDRERAFDSYFAATPTSKRASKTPERRGSTGRTWATPNTITLKSSEGEVVRSSSLSI